MALDIGAALSRGFRRTFERNGLVLMGVFLLFKLVNSVVGQSFSAAMNRAMRDLMAQVPEAAPPQFTTGPTPFAIDMPVSLAFSLLLLTALLAEAIFIVAVRTMVSDETETIPGEFVGRLLPVATINGFVGGIVVSFLTVVGLLLLVIPGIFIALSFFFVRQEIAVEDKNFLDAMSGSWALTRGNRIELFALAIVVVIAGLLAGVLTAPLVFLGEGAAAIASAVVDSVFTVFGVAVAARAYDQLRSGETAGTAGGGPGPVDAATAADIGSDTGAHETDPTGR